MAVEFPYVDQTFYTGFLVKPLGGIDVPWVVGGVGDVVF
jgi:hypothetical protein